MKRFEKIALPGKRKDKIAIGNCSAKASLNYTRWFTMQIKGKRFVFDKEEPRSKKCGNVDKNVDNFLSNYEK